MTQVKLIEVKWFEWSLDMIFYFSATHLLRLQYMTNFFWETV